MDNQFTISAPNWQNPVEGTLLITVRKDGPPEVVLEGGIDPHRLVGILEAFKLGMLRAMEEGPDAR